MVKKLTFTLLSTMVFLLGATLPVLANEEEDITAYKYPVYRLYNPNSGEHFYTKEDEEKDYLSSIGWKYEGIGWYAPGYEYLYDAERGFDPFVHRLYNPQTGEHHYTEDTNERSILMRTGWKSEKTCWYSEDKTKAVPVYRVYNPNKKIGSHHYTTEISERDSLVANGWKDEGIAWYAIQKGELLPYTPEPTPTSPVAPSTPAQVNYSEAYRPILDEAQRIINEKGNGNYRADLAGVADIATYKSTSLNDIGYAIQDLSGDGIPELILGVLTSSNYIVAVYTLAENTPVNALYGWSRSSYHYAGGSTFIYTGSGGAYSSNIGLLSLTPNGQNVTYSEYYYTEPNDSWTAVKTYSSSGPNSTGKYIGGGEAYNQNYERIFAKKQSLNLTPLSQWK